MEATRKKVKSPNNDKVVFAVKLFATFVISGEIIKANPTDEVYIPMEDLSGGGNFPLEHEIGTPTVVPGIKGNALLWEGTALSKVGGGTDNCFFNTSLCPGYEYTLSLWFKMPVLSTAFIIDHYRNGAYDGWYLKVMPHNDYNYKLFGRFDLPDGHKYPVGSHTSDWYPLQIDTWYHVAVVIGDITGDGKIDSQLYINGDKSGIREWREPADPLLINDEVFIGDIQTDAETVCLDELQFWAEKKDQEFVKELFREVIEHMPMRPNLSKVKLYQDNTKIENTIPFPNYRSLQQCLLFCLSTPLCQAVFWQQEGKVCSPGNQPLLDDHLVAAEGLQVFTFV